MESPNAEGVPSHYARNFQVLPTPFGRTTFCDVHRLTKAQARRVAVRAQMLDAKRPSDLVSVVRQLTFLQIDPTAAIAPSADIVAWSRLGSSYRPENLKRELEEKRTLFELDAMVRPMSDVGLYLASAEQWTDYDQPRNWMTANDKFRRDILKLLRRSGPLASREIPDTCVVPWASTGWTNDRNVTQMLEYMAVRGEIAIAGRIGRERVWDLAERVYPKVKVPPVEEAAAPEERAAARSARHRAREAAEDADGAGVRRRRR